MTTDRITNDSTSAQKFSYLRIKLPRGWTLNTDQSYERYCHRCGSYHWKMGWEPE